MSTAAKRYIVKHTGHSIATPIYEFEPANIDLQERPRTIRGEPPSDHAHQWKGLCSFPEGEILECDCGAK